MSASTAPHTPLVDTTCLIETNGKRKRLSSPEDTKGFIDLSQSGNTHYDEFFALLQDILVILRRFVIPHVPWLACLWSLCK